VTLDKVSARTGVDLVAGVWIAGTVRRGMACRDRGVIGRGGVRFGKRIGVNALHLGQWWLSHLKSDPRRRGLGWNIRSRSRTLDCSGS
jgi:hypothetical protein